MPIACDRRQPEFTLTGNSRAIVWRSAARLLCFAWIWSNVKRSGDRGDDWGWRGDDPSIVGLGVVVAQRFDHLHLNDDSAFDGQVQAILTDYLSLVGHAHFDPGSDGDALLLQFDNENPPIDCFAETRPKDLREL
jgi:hypothetical protein